MSSRVPVSMLPFAVELEIIEERRRLDSILLVPQSPSFDSSSTSSLSASSIQSKSKSSLPTYEELFGKSESQSERKSFANIDMEDMEGIKGSRELSTTATIDETELTGLLEQYFEDSFNKALTESSSLANLIYIHLVPRTPTRRQLGMDTDMDVNMDLDIDVDIDVDMDMGSSLQVETEELMYDAVDGVHEQGSRYLRLNDHSFIPRVMDVPMQQQQLRKDLIISTYTVNYDGFAVFERDGIIPIPDKNYIQSLQLQAFTGLNEALISEFQKTELKSGLQNVASVTASILTTSSTSGSEDEEDVQSVPRKSKFDVIIIVAIAVASCSLTLLGCALFLAFRRRKQGNDHVDRSHPNQNSHEKLNLRIPAGAPSNATSPTKKTTSEISPTTVMAPPVFEMNVDQNHDPDDISEYTESLFSAPIGNTGNTTGGSKTRNGYMATSTSNKMEHGTAAAGGSGGGASGFAKVSSRFNPRYILGSRSGTSDSEGDSDIIGGLQAAGGVPGSSEITREMDGVPPLTTPVRKALQSTGALHSSSPDIGERNSRTPNSASSSPSLTGRKATRDVADSGFYSEGVIDDDIASSLRAYKEAERAKATNRLYQGSNGGDSVDDNVSLSSAGDMSYGFSLDGNSTVANSTKYGY